MHVNSQSPQPSTGVRHGLTIAIPHRRLRGINHHSTATDAHNEAKDSQSDYVSLSVPVGDAGHVVGEVQWGRGVGVTGGGGGGAEGLLG